MYYLLSFKDSAGLTRILIHFKNWEDPRQKMFLSVYFNIEQYETWQVKMQKFKKKTGKKRETVYALCVFINVVGVITIIIITLMVSKIVQLFFLSLLFPTDMGKLWVSCRYINLETCTCPKYKRKSVCVFLSLSYYERTKNLFMS